MIELVLIQRREGERGPWLCRHGFRRKGHPTTFFDAEELEDGRVSPTPTTLVTGGIATVYHALSLLNAAPPNIDYPESLRSYLGRRVEATTIGDLISRFASSSPPAFVKPIWPQKAFPGTVIREFIDLFALGAMPNHPVWASEVVEFVSEWRFFVRRDRIVGCCHDDGNRDVRPDLAVVRAAVSDYRRESPAAYVIDFGVAADGRTLLVEVNDGYAFGALSLPSAEYVEMLEDRWVEMVTGRRPW